MEAATLFKPLKIVEPTFRTKLTFSVFGQSLSRMAIQNYLFAEPGLQQLPEKIAQLAYRLHPQPGLRYLTSRV